MDSYHPQGAVPTQQTETHLQALCEGGQFACLGSSARGAGSWVSTSLGAYADTVCGWGLVSTISVTFLCFALGHWHLLGGNQSSAALISVADVKVTTCLLPGSGGQRDLH